MGRAGRTGRAFADDDRAAASTLAYAVAGLVLVAAFAALLLAAREDSGASALEAAGGEEAGQERTGSALSVAQFLVQSPGQPGRPGLRLAGGNGLDPAKLATLSGTSYDTVRANFGLDDLGLGLHVRTVPHLDGVTHGNATPGAYVGPQLGLDVAYLGAGANPAAEAGETLVLAEILGDGVLGSLANFTDDALAPFGVAQFMAEVGDLVTPPDVVVVGSDVDHAALVGYEAEVAAFVQGGGTLVVFGTAYGTGDWLADLGMAVAATPSNSAGQPDPSHPILHVPNTLAIAGYGQCANPSDCPPPLDLGAAALALDTVAMDGQGPVLQVSRPGSLGSGRLLAVRAYASDPLDSGTIETEAYRLMHNLLLRHYSALFLDYGQPLPAQDTRSASVWSTLEVAGYDFDADAAADEVPVQVVVRVFPAG